MSKDKEFQFKEELTAVLKAAEEFATREMNKPLEVKIKYHDDELKKVEKFVQGDLIDLRASEDVEMKQFDYKEISLGVSMIIPKGYKANVYPRSSTYRNFGIILANSVGQIDNSFSGTNDVWCFPAIALRDTVIKKNDRICQFEIVPIQPNINFVESETLNDIDRGGIGSTGTK